MRFHQIFCILARFNVLRNAFEVLQSASTYTLLRYRLLLEECFTKKFTTH